MAKIDELLKELCPDGVECLSLGSIGKICMCKRIMKDQTNTTSGVPFYKIGTFGKEADAYISYDLYKEYKHRFSFPQKGYVLISASGTIGRAVIYNGEDAYFQDSNIVWIENREDIVLNKYLYYCYMTMDWVTEGGTIKRLYNSNLAKMKIFVPSLSRQQEIVEVLDTFTDAISNLEEELALREKQLEFYRSEFVDNKLYSEVKLKDVASYSKLKINALEVNKDTYISVENLLQNKAGKIESSCCPTNGKCIKFLPKDILIGNIRPYLKKIWFSDCEGGTNGDVLDIRVKSDTLDPKYLFEILSSDNFFRYYTQHSAGGKMPRGDKNAVMNYSFCIPPIERQHEIVEILDTFEAMIANIKEEIALRTKQYEYYREKLLSFGK